MKKLILAALACAAAGASTASQATTVQLMPTITVSATALAMEAGPTTYDGLAPPAAVADSLPPRPRLIGAGPQHPALKAQERAHGQASPSGQAQDDMPLALEAALLLSAFTMIVYQIRNQGAREVAVQTRQTKRR